MTGALDRQDMLNQACNHKRAYLFYKTVGWQNCLILPGFSNKKRFSNKKEYCSCEIAATHAGFSHIQVGMATKLYVLIFDSTCDWRSMPVVSWTRA